MPPVQQLVHVAWGRQPIALTPLSNPCAAPADANETHTLQPLSSVASSLTSLKLLHLPNSHFDLSHLSRLQALRVLALSPDDDWDSARSYSPLPGAVLQRLTGLEHLHMDAGTIWRADAGQLAQLTRLTHLSVLSLRVEGPAAAVLRLPHLRQLGCAYIGPVQQPSPAAAAPLLPQLTQLRVGWLHQLNLGAENLHPYIDDPAVGGSAAAARALFSTAGCLRGLLPLPQLLELELTVDDGDWAALAGELAQQTSLTSLQLEADDKEARVSLLDMAPLLVPCLQPLAQLEQLRLATAELDLACFQAIAALPRLERLELRGCGFSVAHTALLHRCAPLAEIIVENCNFDHPIDLLELETLLLPKAGLRVLEVDGDWEHALKERASEWSISDVPMDAAELLGVQLKHHTW
jgi:hypothetical protein